MRPVFASPSARCWARQRVCARWASSRPPWRIVSSTAVLRLLSGTAVWAAGNGGGDSDTLRITAQECNSSQEIFGGNAQTDRSGFDFLSFEGVLSPAPNSQVSGWPLHQHGEVSYRGVVTGDGEQALNATWCIRTAF
jgi:hypothetical protein